MRILHLETGKNLYGGALQVLYLMKGLKSKRCINFLVCTRGSSIGKVASEDSESVYQLPMRGDFDLLFPLRLLRIIYKVRPDIVHVHSRRGADVWGGVASLLNKAKTVITRRVDNPELYWVAKVKYGLYDKVITISEGIREVLYSEGIKGNKIACVPSGVDSDRYTNECDKAWFYKELGYTPEEKVVGVIAQFIPRKGHHSIIEAIPTIHSHLPSVRFLFLGKGPLKNEMYQLCKKKNIIDYVQFAGFRNDLERILPCLDLVLHAATMEGLGVSLLQAAASGVPIVATRVGGIPEIVRDGVNGHLFDPNNTTDMVDATLSLLQDESRAKHFGEAGRQIVQSHFSVEAMVKGNLEVYKSIL